jgi:uncharacterized membrane protein YjgN (DUF898 family)
MNQWHYSINNQTHGPVSAEEIRQLLTAGVINESSLVWCAALTEWTPLGQVPRDLLPETAVSTAPAYAPRAARPAGGHQEVRHQFEFHGRAGEFFRIWIVNVVLTVLTLGIYAAWAKVRTLRYFYGNTMLDGKPFDFTGDPIAILKGNLIFGGIFILYIASSATVPLLAFVVIFGVMVLAPWLIQRALRFRTHNTMHRNVRMNFRGTVSDAYTCYMWLTFLVPFTAGLIMPYIQFRQRHYLMNHLGWGRAAATMQGGPGFFYKTFFKSIAPIFLIAILASIAVPAFNVIQKKANETNGKAESGKSAMVEPAPERSLGLFVSAFAQVSDGTEDTSDNLAVGEEASPSRPMGAFGSAELVVILVILVFYLFMFLMIIYYQVRTHNYSINTTQWSGLGRIESKARARDLLWLYITNGIVVLLTLGLMIPWVKVRMARYTASKTAFIATGSLDSVARAAGGESSAMGDAGADIFDIDIGL